MRKSANAPVARGVRAVCGVDDEGVLVIGLEGVGARWIAGGLKGDERFGGAGCGAGCGVCLLLCARRHVRKGQRGLAHRPGVLG